jgi:flagellin
VDAVFDVSVTTTSGVQTTQFTGGQGPGESGLKLSDSYGNTILLSENGNTSITAPTQVGTLTSGSLRFQIGADADQSVQFSMPVVFANSLGTGAVSGASLNDLDVTSQQGASDAIRIIDAAVTQLAQMRGELGSFQKNFLESTSRSLEVARENLTATESSIRDANMAEEITTYTRLQILQNTGMSVLAQANQAPQNILQLLRSG